MKNPKASNLSEVYPNCTNKKVWEYAMNGATEFCFIIEDEYSQLKYPDFKLKELIRD